MNADDSAVLPLGAANLAEQIEAFLTTPVDLYEDTEYDKAIRGMRAMALLRQSADTLKLILERAEQPEDAAHKLRLRLGDVKNFALALLRAHEGDSIATDIANALLRLVGNGTEQALTEPQRFADNLEAIRMIRAVRDLPYMKENYIAVSDELDDIAAELEARPPVRRG